MADSCAVLIAAPDLLPAFKQRAAVSDAEVLGFADTDVLRALEAITARKPRLVALERLFAATPRGTALINRVKADPSLVQTEIRVLAHDSDYSRVLPRTPAVGSAQAQPRVTDAAAASVAGSTRSPVSAIEAAEPPAALAPAAAEPTAPAATLARLDKVAGRERTALDQKGTRRAPRYAMERKVEIFIDGNPATLLDLSTCGAQVISPTILKPNQRVRVALPDDAGMLRFNASIAWAAFEIPPKIGPQYRAGIDFVDADAAVIDAFCLRHKG